MLLEFNQLEYNIPHTSICHVVSMGTFHRGDVISVTSPIFDSIDFTSKQFKLSSSFDVLYKDDELVVPEDGVDAVLVCDDNDVFHMYVKNS